MVHIQIFFFSQLKAENVHMLHSFDKCLVFLIIRRQLLCLQQYSLLSPLFYVALNRWLWSLLLLLLLRL